MIREEARLAAVTSLSRALLQELAPTQAAQHDQELALWASKPAHLALQESLPSGDLPLPLPTGQTTKSRGLSRETIPSDGLDTTLVAGMFLQVILQAEHLPGTPVERTCFVKQAVKNFLVQRLAGQITLSQFFRLVNLIEQEVGYYFQRLQGQWLGAAAPLTPAQTAINTAATPEIRTAELQVALFSLPLPHQANRKLTPEGLLAFLLETKGKWFRLLDFEAHFNLNKKTAWAYLTLLLQHRIVRHNAQRANKVRYALAEQFLAAPSGPPDQSSRSHAGATEPYANKM